MTAVLTPSPTPWLTFGPDVLAGVISGVVTGLAVGVVFFLLQRRAEARASRTIAVTAGYENLLEILSRLLSLDFSTAGDAKMLGVLRHRMTLFVELTDKDYPDLPLWFDAERQRSIARAMTANDQVGQLSADATPEDNLHAAAPFLLWVRDFTSNVRYWRTGKLTNANIKAQTEMIEAELRKSGQWRTGAFLSDDAQGVDIGMESS
ncbi:MAG: hypothetical protein JWN80_1386 [Microbacteriaceae bacterium]|nr:hypothetical protein [Microbacteriaceae bacterium]